MDVPAVPGQKLLHGVNAFVEQILVYPQETVPGRLKTHVPWDDLDRFDVAPFLVLCHGRELFPESRAFDEPAVHTATAPLAFVKVKSSGFVTFGLAGNMMNMMLWKEFSKNINLNSHFLAQVRRHNEWLVLL